MKYREGDIFYFPDHVNKIYYADQVDFSNGAHFIRIIDQDGFPGDFYADEPWLTITMVDDTRIFAVKEDLDNICQIVFIGERLVK